MNNLLGLCQCGCGQKAPLAPQSSTRQGWIRGQPTKYIDGHRQARNGPEYVVEDRGFETPCWMWQGYVNADGYGRKRVGDEAKPAHRAYYEAAYGSIDLPSIDVHHKCRVRSCVNPEHLEALCKADHVRHRRKITEEQIAEIRSKFVRFVVTHNMLAAEYGISPSYVNRIIGGGKKCS